MPSAIVNSKPDPQAESDRRRPIEVQNTSYRDILKSTAWIGGSQVINVVISMLRAKVMALVLGPAGVGLNGMYWSVLSVAQNVAGLGVSSSGVRQVAEAIGSGDQARVARQIAVLRRLSLWLGIAGGLALIVGAGPIARVTFGRVNQSETVGIALLSIVLLLNLVIAGQGALLQGYRKISEMAQSNVLGALAGTLTMIPLVCFWGTDGVVPGLIVASAATLLVSWHFVRRIDVAKPELTFAETINEAWALTKLGFAFMISSLMTMLSGYAIRLIVIRYADLEATGLYQAAWAIGGMYVSLVLQSMGADFYPRLTKEIRDHATSIRLVNEQTSVSLLLAGPGVAATLVFAPLVLTLFYSAKFSVAVELLRWICLGVSMRVVSWPLGFILLAKGDQVRIIAAEFAWTAVHLGLAWVLVPIWGIDGAGIAFFGSYLFHIAITYYFARKMIGFSWSRDTLGLIVGYVLTLGLAWAACRLLSPRVSFGLGLVFVTGLTLASLQRIAKLGGVPVRFQRFVNMLSPSSATNREIGS